MNQSPVVNELINDAYVIKFIKPKKQHVESLQGGNMEIWGDKQDS